MDYDQLAFDEEHLGINPANNLHIDDSYEDKIKYSDLINNKKEKNKNSNEKFDELDIVIINPQKTDSLGEVFIEIYKRLNVKLLFYMFIFIFKLVLLPEL